MQEKLSANEDETTLQLKVTSCTIFTEVFRVLLKVTWKAQATKPFFPLLLSGSLV